MEAVPLDAPPARHPSGNESYLTPQQSLANHPSCGEGRRQNVESQRVMAPSSRTPCASAPLHCYIPLCSPAAKILRRGAEIRREFFFSAFLRVPLHLCVKPSWVLAAAWPRYAFALVQLQMPVRDKPPNRYDHRCGQITRGIKSVTIPAGRHGSGRDTSPQDTRGAACAACRHTRRGSNHRQFPKRPKLWSAPVTKPRESGPDFRLTFALLMAY